MRAIVVGLGVQGKKRRRFAGPDFVATVDPFNRDADYKLLPDVPLETYDAALCCVPDEPKFELLSYLLGNGKQFGLQQINYAYQEGEGGIAD